MTSSASAARIPDADRRFFAAHNCASGRNITAPAATTKPSPPINADLRRSPRIARTHIDHDHFGTAFQSRQCLDGSRRSRTGRRQLQGRVAAGALPDRVLVQSRQRPLKTGKPRKRSRLSSGAQTNPSHWPSRTNLVQALMATKQYIMAQGAADGADRRAAAGRPDPASARQDLL